MDKGPRSIRSYVTEAGIAIAGIYFLLGGYKWSPAVWAMFSVLAVWVIVMRVLRDVGLETSEAESRQKLQLGFVMVVMVFGAAVWHGSFGTFVLGLLLCWIMIGEYRAHRSVYGRTRGASHSLRSKGEMSVAHLEYLQGTSWPRSGLELSCLT